MRRVVLTSSFVVFGCLAACRPGDGGDGGGGGGGGGGDSSSGGGSCALYNKASVQGSCTDSATGKTCTEFYYMDGATLAERRNACTPANDGTWSTGPCLHTGVDGACALRTWGNCTLGWQPGDTSGCVSNNGTVQWCCQSSINSAKQTCESQGGTFIQGTPPYPIHDPC